MLILTVLIFLSLSNFVTADCPNGTYTIPPNLGASYNCVALMGNDYIRSFFDAEEYCNSVYGGHLVTIPNGYVNTFIADPLTDLVLSDKPYYDRGFIGVTRMVGGVWRNLDDGNTTTYFNWASGEPYNQFPVNCISIDTNGLWHTEFCGCGTGRVGVCSVLESNKTSSEKLSNIPLTKVN